MQTPMPPPLPGLDPNLVFNEVVPIVAAVVVILVVAVALRGLLRTPVGEAIAERIRTRAQRRWGGGGAGEDPQRVAALESQVVAAIRGGDAIMVKGSLGSKMKPVVNALQARFPGKTALDELAV